MNIDIADAERFRWLAISAHKINTARRLLLLTAMESGDLDRVRRLVDQYRTELP